MQNLCEFIVYCEEENKMQPAIIRALLQPCANASIAKRPTVSTQSSGRARYAALTLMAAFATACASQPSDPQGPDRQGQVEQQLLLPSHPKMGWWRADCNSLDTSGKDNHGVSGVQNGATPVSYAPGEVGNAFALNGTSYVQVPNAPTLRITTAITLHAWIFANSLGGRIIDKISVGGGDGYLLDTFSGHLRLIIGNTILFSNSTLPTGTFVHVAGTWDGATGRVYVNGVLDGSKPMGPLPNNTLDLRIGADSNGTNRFNGLIDEANVLNRALSAAQIAVIAAGDSEAPRNTGDVCMVSEACASGLCTLGECGLLLGL